jgi:hypothetical protein
MIISTVSQGKDVPPQELFRYNYGRFLVNEDYEQAKRYSTFDIDALCQMVAALPTVQSPIVKIDKREGGYNKALMMAAENGREVIAKIPCGNIVPREYGTASEVAVLQFGMAGLPHPRPSIDMRVSESSLAQSRIHSIGMECRSVKSRALGVRCVGKESRAAAHPCLGYGVRVRPGAVDSRLCPARK